MSIKLGGLVLAAAIGLSACGTAPKFQERRPTVAAGEKIALGSSPVVQQTNHMTQHLNAEKSIVYSQGFGGGGAGLGLLLGPLGVAANVAMIESNTKADTQKLFGKVPVDPVQSLNKAAKGRQLEFLPSTVAPSNLTPYLHIVKTTETTLSIATALVYESGSKVPAKYVFQLPETYTVEQLSGLDAGGSTMLQNSVDVGFNRLLAFFIKDVGDKPAEEQQIQFKSSFVSPRFEFELMGAVAEKNDDVTWIRTVGAVYGLQKAAVSVSPAR